MMGSRVSCRAAKKRLTSMQSFGGPDSMHLHTVPGGQPLRRKDLWRCRHNARRPHGVGGGAWRWSWQTTHPFGACRHPQTHSWQHRPAPRPPGCGPTLPPETHKYPASVRSEGALIGNDISHAHTTRPTLLSPLGVNPPPPFYSSPPRNPPPSPPPPCKPRRPRPLPFFACHGPFLPPASRKLAWRPSPPSSSAAIGRASCRERV